MHPTANFPVFLFYFSFILNQLEVARRTIIKVQHFGQAFFLGEVQSVLIFSIAFAGDKLLFGWSQASSTGEAGIIMQENQFLVKNRQKACCGHTLSGTLPFLPELYLVISQNYLHVTVFSQFWQIIYNYFSYFIRMARKPLVLLQLPFLFSVNCSKTQMGQQTCSVFGAVVLDTKFHLLLHRNGKLWLGLQLVICLTNTSD